ncbi:MAG: BadF/BadG/BcrA/BcrD ATPase family protein [Rhodothermales bacterium]|nr:BadF/BadG/BcrA/BcrD ATPase family protein [Rhodothermales bacterium]
MPLLYVGLDAGGTKTEVLARAGAAEHRATGPGVNLQRDGAEAAAERLATLTLEALEALPHDGLGGVGAGVAGAGRSDEQADLAERLRQRLGAHGSTETPVRVGHDAAVALDGALDGGSGMVVVVGTGSMVLARTEGGDVHRAGGWGARIGDPGSGTALGAAALAAVADAFDGGKPTTLRDRLAQAHGIAEPDDLIRAVYQEGLSAPALAPLVVAAAEGHDWVATRVLQREANALAERAGLLATRLQDADLAHRVALVGGLATEAHYREVLAGALLRHLPDWRIVRPAASPVEGALRLAQQAPQTQP